MTRRIKAGDVVRVVRSSDGAKHSCIVLALQDGEARLLARVGDSSTAGQAWFALSEIRVRVPLGYAIKRHAAVGPVWWGVTDGRLEWGDKANRCMYSRGAALYLAKGKPGSVVVCVYALRKVRAEETKMQTQQNQVTT